MITKVIGILLILLFLVQTLFNVLLKIEHTRLRLKSNLREKDGRKFLRRIKYVLWILPTKKNTLLIQECYSNILTSTNICLDTQWAVYKALQRRFVKKIQKPKNLPINPFHE